MDAVRGPFARSTTLNSAQSRFQRGARFGSLRGSVPGVWSSSTICGVFLLGNKSELSHNNDGTATVRVLHYTQCIAA